MSLQKQFEAAGYQTAPDPRLPLNYLPETLKLMACIAEDVVEGTLRKVRNGELSTANIITDEAGGAAAIVTYADTEAEKQLTPLQTDLTPDGLDLLVTGEEGLKADPALNADYKDLKHDMIGIFDPVDGTWRYTHWLKQAAQGIEHVQADGSLAGYGTGFTLARRETIEGVLVYEPIASIIYWPDQKRFAILQPNMGAFTGDCIDPISGTFSNIQKLTLQPANPSLGTLFAADLSWDIAGHKIDTPAQRARYFNLETEFIDANAVADRFIKAARKGKPFITAYDSASQYWDAAHGYLIAKIMGQSGSALAHDRPYHPWLDMNKAAVIASSADEAHWVRDEALQAARPDSTQKPIEKKLVR